MAGMTGSRQETVTRLLQELRAGDQSALNDLLPVVYDELHQAAERQPEERVEGRAPAARRPQGAQGTLRRAPAPRGGRRLHPGHGITLTSAGASIHAATPRLDCGKPHPTEAARPNDGTPPDPGRCPASSRCHTAPHTRRRGGTR